MRDGADRDRIASCVIFEMGFLECEPVLTIFTNFANLSGTVRVCRSYRSSGFFRGDVATNMTLLTELF